MSGIAGFIQRTPGVRRDDDVRRMVQRMCHEPGLVSGQEAWDHPGLTAGWVSRPGSFSDCLPAWNEDRSVCLLFSGEDFSAQSASNCQNASALVRRFEEEGLGFIAQLNGWFSGLLVDLRAGRAVLFNDRYGSGRIYCHASSEGLYFASEAKSLLAVLSRLRRVDPRGLAEFISVGCVLQNRTLFPDIALLPGGSMWTFHHDGRVEKQRYFNPETWEQQPSLTPVDYGERLQEVFSRVAPRYLRGPRRVGLSLTGGLDSRMILAWAGAAPGSLPCYTFGGPYRDCADVRIARRLARTCGQSHTTLPIRPEFFREFPSLAEKAVYLSDGTMDVSGAVELHLNRQARDIAPVRLTGNYGSEILRSNVAFRPGRPDTSLFTPEFVRLLNEAAQTYRTQATGNRLSFIAFKQVPWHHHARKALEQSQLTVRSPFLDNELVALAYQTPPELATSPQPVLQLIADGNPALDSIGTDRALRQRSIPVVSSLTNAWQEFSAKAEYAWDYGMPDWLARLDHAVKPLHCERLFLGRHKFYHFRVWYRDQLAEHLKAWASDSQSTPWCYRPESVKRLISDHVSGRCNRTLELHKLLTVQLTERLFTSAS